MPRLAYEAFTDALGAVQLLLYLDPNNDPDHSRELARNYHLSKGELLRVLATYEQLTHDHLQAIQPTRRRPALDGLPVSLGHHSGPFRTLRSLVLGRLTNRATRHRKIPLSAR